MIGYANKYIFDMNKITSIEDVNALIAAGVEESTKATLTQLAINGKAKCPRMLVQWLMLMVAP